MIDRYRLTIIGDNTLECEFLMDDKTFKQVNDDIFSKLEADGPYAPRVIIRNLSLEEREKKEREREEKERRRKEELESQKKFAEMCSHLGMWKLGDSPKIREALEAFRTKYGMTEELPESSIEEIEKQAKRDIEFLNSRLNEMRRKEDEQKASHQKFIDKVSELVSDMPKASLETVKCPFCNFEFATEEVIGIHACPKCGKEFGIANINDRPMRYEI